MGVAGFEKISVLFRIDGRTFSGVGIASADCLYLILLRERRIDRILPWVILFGAIGALIANVLSSKEVDPDPRLSVETFPVKKLPLEIRKHRDWPFPFTAKMEGYWVLCIPRSGIEAIRHPAFTNLLTLKFGAARITMQYPSFRGAKVRDYLVATGWRLKWGWRRLGNW